MVHRLAVWLLALLGTVTVVLGVTSQRAVASATDAATVKNARVAPIGCDAFAATSTVHVELPKFRLDAKSCTPSPALTTATTAGLHLGREILQSRRIGRRARLQRQSSQGTVGSGSLHAGASVRR